MKVYAIKCADGSEFLMRMLMDNATIEGELAKWPEDKRALVVSHEEIPADTYADKRREIFKPTKPATE